MDAAPLQPVVPPPVDEDGPDPAGLLLRRRASVVNSAPPTAPRRSSRSNFGVARPLVSLPAVELADVPTTYKAAMRSVDASLFGKVRARKSTTRCSRTRPGI